MSFALWRLLFIRWWKPPATTSSPPNNGGMSSFVCWTSRFSSRRSWRSIATLLSWSPRPPNSSLEPTRQSLVVVLRRKRVLARKDMTAEKFTAILAKQVRLRE